MAPSQTFHDHIKEFRRRLLWVMLAAIVAAGIAYVLRTPIVEVLQRPLGIPLYYTSPAGSFNFIMRIAMVIGIFVALPVGIYQLLRFLEPAMPININRLLMFKVIGCSFLLATAGVAFGYFIMLPMSLDFFAGYSSEDIKPLINADQYLSYVINNLLIFAITFQLPIIALFINRIKPLKPSQLLHYQRHVIAGALVFAVLLPFTYEPVSQFIVAAPIVGLYYLSILLIALANWRFNKKQAKKGRQPAVRPFVAPNLPTLAIDQGVKDLPVRQLRPAMLHTRSTDGMIRQPSNNISVPEPINSVALPVEEPQSRQPALKPFYGRPVAIDGISRLLNPAP